MTHSGLLEINLKALSDNYFDCKKRSGEADCGAAVKANAYGLGIIEVAEALSKSGCHHFFVAHLDEGIMLRKNQPTSKIFILHGWHPQGASDYLKYNLTPVFNSSKEIALYGGKPKAVMVDTGINRLGLNYEQDLTLLEGVEWIFSHFACSDTPNHPLNMLQIERFKAMQAKFPNAKHSLSNSDGLSFNLPQNLTRVGIALYDGVNSVVTLKASILMTRTIKKGESVGYGGTFTADKDMQVSIASLGYADGFLRAGQGGDVMIRDQLCPIIGRISMDLTAIDTSQFKDPIRAYEEAFFINETLRPSLVAKKAGTISYELLTRLGNRLKRIYSE